MFYRAIMLFAALLLFSTNAASFNGYVEVTNKTGFNIIYLYISHADSTDWEEDVLDEDILRNGRTVKVNLRGAESSIFDIRGQDEDGDTYTLYDVDVSRRDVVFTLKNID